MAIFRRGPPNVGVECKEGMKQELSYRKQIVRQLRTQYAEGINDNPVTLKSRSTVILNGTIR